MNGMEMMLSRLIGMKPDEMRAKVEQAVSLMEHGAKTMQKVQDDLDAIKKHLGIETQEIENNGGRIASRGDSANGNHIQL